MGESRETKFLPSQIPKSQSIINRHAAACWAGISKHEKQLEQAENSAKCRHGASHFGFREKSDNSDATID